MSRKKHLLAGVLASALLVFGLAGLDLTKATPEDTESVNENNIVEQDSGSPSMGNIDMGIKIT